jgi:hypothetical protein
MQVTEYWADGLGQPLAMCYTFTVQQRYRTIRSEARANVTRHMNKATAGSYWRLLWSAVCRVLVMAWRALLLKSSLARISGYLRFMTCKTPLQLLTGASEVQYAIIRLGRMAIPKVTGVEMFFLSQQWKEAIRGKGRCAVASKDLPAGEVWHCMGHIWHHYTSFII